MKTWKAAALAAGGVLALNGVFWLVMYISAETGLRHLDFSFRDG